MLKEESSLPPLNFVKDDTVKETLPIVVLGL